MRIFNKLLIWFIISNIQSLQIQKIQEVQKTPKNNNKYKNHIKERGYEPETMSKEKWEWIKKQNKD